MIPVYKPYLPDDSLRYAHDALRSQWIIWTGEYKDKARQMLEGYLGSKHVLLLGNGTMACHLMSKCLRMRHPMVKRVIVPNNVYVAAWNGLLFDADANYTLVPIEPDINTWNMDTNLIGQQLDEGTAVLVVHNIGNIINVPKLLARFPGLVTIEDNCEGFSGEYNGIKSGVSSLCSAISFCGNKTITCGEGVALITNDDELYREMAIYHCQGQTDETYVHDRVGYNYRMTNIQAAILVGQMHILQDIKNKKHEIFNLYRKLFSGIREVVLQKDEIGTVNAEWLFGIRVLNSEGYHSAKKFYNEHGIDIRPMFYPITKHKHLSGIECRIENASILSKECILLPSYPDLAEDDIVKVVDVTKKYINRSKTNA